MISKEKKIVLKIQLKAGKATSAPPLGPLLHFHGVNSSVFIKDYNDKTKNFIGKKIPIRLTIYTDKTYDFTLLKQTTSDLLLEHLDLKKGSSKGSKDIIGTLNKEQLEKIAVEKYSEFNSNSLNTIKNIIIGTAKNMGINIL